VQEGGDVKFKATDEPPVRLPVLVRAQGAGESHAHVTWFEPSEGTTRLLTALFTRGGPEITLLSAKPRLLELAMTPACHVNPLGGKTTDWRAVCGKSACTVRREGGPRQPALPTPIVWDAPASSSTRAQSDARGRRSVPDGTPTQSVGTSDNWVRFGRWPGVEVGFVLGNGPGLRLGSSWEIGKRQGEPCPTVVRDQSFLANFAHVVESSQVVHFLGPMKLSRDTRLVSRVWPGLR
jgi:hypothetical protein